jgi:probable rRNA maturation factor
MTVRVAVRAEPRSWRDVPKEAVARRARAMLRALQLNKIDLSIVLTNDVQIQSLNNTYRGNDRSTDVLAFSLREGEMAAFAGNALGDVVISVPTARRQALERELSTLDEVTFLLAHGLLHLLGHDHDTAARERRMRRESARLCEAAGGAAATRAVRRAETAPPRRRAHRSSRGRTSTDDSSSGTEGI